MKQRYNQLLAEIDRLAAHLSDAVFDGLISESDAEMFTVSLADQAARVQTLAEVSR